MSESLSSILRINSRCIPSIFSVSDKGRLETKNYRYLTIDLTYIFRTMVHDLFRRKPRNFGILDALVEICSEK